MEALLGRIKQAVLSGEEEQVRDLVGEVLLEGSTPARVVEDAMMPAMEDVGARFSAGQAFIPELIVAASAMEAGMEVLKPHLGKGSGGIGKVVMGTVQGDIHSIGKNLVRMCMEGAGFEVVDIGEDAKAEVFARAYLEHRPQLLGLSALLSSTMQRMKEVIEVVREIDSGSLIMVGGAPITQDFADEIGASGYAPNAFEAAVKARELLENRT